MAVTTSVSKLLEACMIFKLGEIGVDNPECLGLGLHRMLFRTIYPGHWRLQDLHHVESDIADDAGLLESLKNLHVSKYTLFGAFTFLTDTLDIENGEVSWWKILTLIHCSAELAVRCVDRELPNMVENIFLWTSRILERDHVNAWIEEHGGWEFLTNGRYGTESM